MADKENTVNLPVAPFTTTIPDQWTEVPRAGTTDFTVWWRRFSTYLFQIRLVSRKTGRNVRVKNIRIGWGNVSVPTVYTNKDRVKHHQLIISSHGIDHLEVEYVKGAHCA